MLQLYFLDVTVQIDFSLTSDLTVKLEKVIYHGFMCDAIKTWYLCTSYCNMSLYSFIAAPGKIIDPPVGSLWISFVFSQVDDK